MSVRVSAWAWDAKCPSPSAKLVLLSLADHANDDGECWPSQGNIAADCGITRQTVNEQIRRLVEAGLLKIEHRFNGTGQQANRYFLLCRDIRHPLSGYPTPPVGSADTEPSIEEDSVSSLRSETAAVPHPDPVKALFDATVLILTRRGLPEARARAMIGKYRKALHDDGRLMAIVLSVERQNPVDIVPYLDAAVRKAANGGWNTNEGVFS